MPQRTEWHNLVLWRRLAEVAEKYVHKGDKLYVEGKIRTRSYDDPSGVRRSVTEIFVDVMEMLTPRNANAGSEAQVAPISASPRQEEELPRTSPATTEESKTNDLPF